MTITQTISEGETYEVIAHAHISKEHFELESLMYHCKTSMNAVDITDFICDYLSVMNLNKLLLTNTTKYYGTDERIIYSHERIIRRE